MPLMPLILFWPLKSFLILLLMMAMMLLTPLDTSQSYIALPMPPMFTPTRICSLMIESHGIGKRVARLDSSDASEASDASDTFHSSNTSLPSDACDGKIRKSIKYD